MDQAIIFLSEELNQYLKRELGLSEDSVRVGRLIHQDGAIPEENQNKLLFSFVSLSQETTKALYGNKMGFTSGGLQGNQTPLYYNLEILLAAVFDDEKESLKFLSKGVTFFHENTHFDKSNKPNMPEGVEKITVELMNLSLQDADALWSSIGTKAVPSVLYKVRVISINNSFDKKTPSVSGDQA